MQNENDIAKKRQHLIDLWDNELNEEINDALQILQPTFFCHFEGEMLPEFRDFSDSMVLHRPLTFLCFEVLSLPSAPNEHAQLLPTDKKITNLLKDDD